MRTDRELPFLRFFSATTATVVAVMLAMAASAQAWTLEWEPVGQTAAGASAQAEVSAISGVPYATWVDAGLIRVSRLASDGTWQPVGGAVNHDASEPGAKPHLADIDGTPWIAWAERDAKDVGQVRVARLTGGSWQEVVGGDRPVNRYPDDPLFTGWEGRLASFGGRVYLAFREDGGSDQDLYVSRLSSDGSTWEPVGTGHVNGSPLTLDATMGIVVSGGQLYFGYDEHPGVVFAARLAAAGNGFARVGKAISGPNPDGQFVALSDAGGTLEVLWRKDGPSAQLSKLAAGDTWVPLTSDSGIPGVPTGVTQASGLTYIASVGTDHLAHVTFFNGNSWEQAPDPSTQLAPATPPSLTTVADDPYVGYQRGSDLCVARLDSEIDSSADDDSCGPAFAAPVASQTQQSTQTSSEQSAPDALQTQQSTPVGSDEPMQAPAAKPVQCRVPRLKGKTLRAARIALARSHCSLGRVSRHWSRSIRHRRVIGSAPGAGALLADGAAVRVVVAR